MSHEESMQDQGNDIESVRKYFDLMDAEREYQKLKSEIRKDLEADCKLAQRERFKHILSEFVLHVAEILASVFIYWILFEILLS